MWKIFLVIAAFTLGGAGYLSYENKNTFEETKDDRIKKVKEWDGLKVEVADKEMTLAETRADTEKLVAETKTLENQFVVVQGQVTDADAKITELKREKEVVMEKLKLAQEISAEFPKLDELRTEMTQIRAQIDQLSIEIAGLQKQTATANVQKEQYQKIADELVALADDQKNGKIRNPFASTVKRAYNNWGFVIIEGGNEQGVVNRAQLDVSRRGQQVCKLIVTTVEPGESVAEVIPGSMAPGQTIQQGDTVTKTDNPIQTAPAGGVETVIPGGGAPATAPAGGGADPLNGLMEASGAGAEDPLFPDDGGAMEAPAGGGSDNPFGDPDASGGATTEPPAGGGGGAEADPFQ